MNIRQLKHFVTVAKHNSLAAASLELYMSPSSLSKAITALEGELGVSLFDRFGGNRLKLNARGETFLHYVQLFFAELNEAEREMINSEQNAGEIWYSVPETEILTSVLEPFLDKYPNMRLHQSLYPYREAVSSLLDYELDFILSYLPPNHPDLQWTPILRQELLVLAGSNSVLSRYKTISPGDLIGRKFVSNNSCSDFQDICDSYCRRAGFIPLVVFEADTPNLINNLLLKRDCVAFIPSLIQMRNEQGVAEGFIQKAEVKAAVPRLLLTGDTHYFDLGIITVKKRYLTRSVRTFIDYITTRLQEENTRYNLLLEEERRGQDGTPSD